MHFTFYILGALSAATLLFVTFADAELMSKTRGINCGAGTGVCKKITVQNNGEHVTSLLQTYINDADDHYLYENNELIACVGEICAFYEKTESTPGKKAGNGLPRSRWQTSGQRTKELMADLVGNHCKTCGQVALQYPQNYVMNYGYLKIDHVKNPNCLDNGLCAGGKTPKHEYGPDDPDDDDSNDIDV